MEICAVICELNPPHCGHRYIFEQAKAISGCDTLIAVMSGNFTQRAEPAVVDEYARCVAAFDIGADLVIELPIIYSAASGDVFAAGAVKLLSEIEGVTHLVAGSECGNINLINTLAKVRADESQTFKKTLTDRLNGGLSYARALTEATAEECLRYGIDKSIAMDALTRPNNLLSVAYKKALLMSGSTIKFETVKRNDDFVSASNIRKNLSDNIEAIPESVYKILYGELQKHFVRQNEYETLLLHCLKNASEQRIAAAPDCAEGLECRIKACADKAADYTEFLRECSSARYPTGRVKRIALHTLLGIDKATQNCGYDCARLLGIKNNASSLLGKLPSCIISNKQAEKNVPQKYSAALEADKAACRLYYLLTHKNGNGYYHGLIKS